MAAQSGEHFTHRALVSELGMEEQQNQLIQKYPNPSEHPFLVRLPAHPEDPEDDQALYHLPGYDYPHTLTFLNGLTPEAEARMIKEFHEVRKPSVAPHANNVRKLGKDRTKSIRNGSVPTNLLLNDIYDDTSDTEPNSNEELAQKYLITEPPPAHLATAVFRPDTAAIHSNPTIPNIQTGKAAESDIHYPTLPSCSFHSSTSLYDEPASQKVLPLGSPTPDRTPAGYLATYRPRTPHDTVFYRGSAGVNPLGAFDRPLRPARKPISKSTGPARPHKFVSGSFGSFDGPPSRFAERGYRLLPNSAQEDEK